MRVPLVYAHVEFGEFISVAKTVRKRARGLKLRGSKAVFLSGDDDVVVVVVVVGVIVSQVFLSFGELGLGWNSFQSEGYGG